MANEHGPPKGSIAFEHGQRGDAAPRADTHDDQNGRPDRRRNGNGGHHGERRRNGHGRKSTAQGFVHRPAVLIGGAIVLALIGAAAVLWWLQARHFESTDDAFIDTHIIRVSPQIAGRVVRIYVDDNQRVAAGAPLADIDPAEPQARLDEARAQADHAQTQLGLAQAQARVARASYEQAVATQAGVAAQTENAERDFARYKSLKAAAPTAVSQQQMDQAAATAHNADAQRQAADQQVKGAAAQIAAADAQVASAEAQVHVAQAQLEQAQINLGYTHVVAPMAGTVAQRTVALGNYVSPGQQMMAVVPLDIWITANFKETELAHMRVGQKVDAIVDACPAARIHGHVDSIQRGAGQAFGVLPPENATGNWVKVVQRVPVKIVFDDLQVDGCTLGPGMSVEPKVRVR